MMAKLYRFKDKEIFIDNDDRQIGRILSRRDALKLLGLTGAALLAACAPDGTATGEPTSASVSPTTVGDASSSLPACVVRPEVTEGPYYVDEDLNRGDIRSDPATGVVKEGALLELTFNVSQISEAGCTPLEGAKVEVWHCDAAGIYSDVSDPGFNTQGQKFLRGYQVTDANGQATFLTIYPGWYSGRTVHIHFKVYEDTSEQGRVFTSQLFFDDSFTAQVFAQEPYASKGQRNTLNSNDNIYQDELLLDVSQTSDGYAAAFDIGLQLD
jgi:protocatechuate 3,4-dioxygenase beta subunit